MTERDLIEHLRSRELLSPAWAAKLYRDAAAEIERLRAENAELRKDSTRLDWLDHHRDYGFILLYMNAGSFWPTLRAAVDAAREREKP